jgi:acyl-coenzyme A thioesterase 9
VKINKLVPSSPYEQVVFNIRQRKLQQRKKQKQVVQTDAQRASETAVLTALVERGSAIVDMPALAHPNAVLMGQTTLENCFLCQPQNGNMAGSVFGGFLMHRAYDIAAAAAYTFAGARPHFLECDRIQFLRSVEIGDLVRLKSRVTYSSDDPVKPAVHVEVTCQVMKPEKAVSYISNTFHFIYGFDSNITLRRVVPGNYEEARLLVKASQWSEGSQFNSLETLSLSPAAAAPAVGVARR